MPYGGLVSNLEYIYSGTQPQSKLDLDAIIGVLNLAHLYGLQNVDAGIKKSLLHKLDLSNVCMILNGARSTS
ncbi:GL15143 [Drosophila persimilis]|uniref:GL15143 n=1 Tax=Drosophila persimilis TaxID=7234 RepID=B4GPV2_DROPE|nr:GL15143 [Drosophila persimilis]